MNTKPIQIFWNSSHLWGLMAHWALINLGIPCQLISAKEIAQGCLMRNPPALLLVPGGSARQKAGALGKKGIKAIRDWTAAGGIYMGICGGAGLALTSRRPDAGLAICPWHRNTYSERVYHLLSGHLYISTGSRSIPAAVWWPGRFDPEPGFDIKVLASYLKPASDLWVADMPVFSIPSFVRSAWQKAGFLSDDLHLPPAHPLVITGKFEKGRYILSYAHLETPASPAANEWLAFLLQNYADIKTETCIIPKWDCFKNLNEILFPDPYSIIGRFYRRLREIMAAGENMGLFFSRTSWLTGWHPGFPGMIFNHLVSCAHTLLTLQMPSCFSISIEETSQSLSDLLDKFCMEAETFLWTYKLKNTLNANQSHIIDNETFYNKKVKLFGTPMEGGGLAQKILDKLETLILCAYGNNSQTRY